MKQVIPTYINHSRPLIPAGIHLFLSTRFERRTISRSQTCPYMLSAKQGNIWYHFHNVFSVTRSGIEPRPPAHEANALTTKPPRPFWTANIKVSSDKYQSPEDNIDICTTKPWKYSLHRMIYETSRHQSHQTQSHTFRK